MKRLTDRVSMVFGVVLSVFICLPCSEAQAQASSFVGLNLHGDYAKSSYKEIERNGLPLFNQAGTKSYGQSRISWSKIEPTPPYEGVHTYDWSFLDQEIEAVQALGGTLYPDIICDAPWAVETTQALSSPPKDDATCAQDNPNMGMSCRDAWTDFIGALVERYDYDGIDDMPGLEYGHLVWQIGTELENPEQWNTADGTQRAEKYVDLLAAAYGAAKQANADAKIISFTFSFGDGFDDNPSIADFNAISVPDAVLRREFTVQVWQQGQAYFDYVGTNVNFHYNGIPARVRWIRSYLPDKPIWFDDAAPVRLLDRTYLQPPLYDETVYPFKTETRIGEILIFKSEPEHVTIKKWWEGEKAKYGIKKALLAAAQGVERISFEFMFDLIGIDIQWGTIAQMAYSLGCGLLEGGLDAEPRGTPKPLYYTMKLFNQKVGRFDAVADLNPLPEGVDPTGWTWILKFTKDSEDCLVVWTEGPPSTVDLSPYVATDNVVATHIVTELDQKFRPVYRDNEIISAQSVPVDPAPIFVEALLSAPPEPLCECRLVPDPYIVQPGTLLGFDATLTNNTDQLQSVYFATKVAVPLKNGYLILPRSGYMRGPYGVTLDPNESKTAVVTLWVPGDAPPNIYTYLGYVGTPEAGIYHICKADFQVAGDQTEVNWPGGSWEPAWRW